MTKLFVPIFARDRMQKMACYMLLVARIYAQANLFWQYIPWDVYYIYTLQKNVYLRSYLLAARLFCDMVLEGCPIKPAASFFITSCVTFCRTTTEGLSNPWSVVCEI